MDYSYLGLGYYEWVFWHLSCFGHLFLSRCQILGFDLYMLGCLHFVSTYLLLDLRFEVSGLKFCVYEPRSFECHIASHIVSTVLHCTLNLLVAYLFVFWCICRKCALFWACNPTSPSTCYLQSFLQEIEGLWIEGTFPSFLGQSQLFSFIAAPLICQVQEYWLVSISNCVANTQHTMLLLGTLISC